MGDEEEQQRSLMFLLTYMLLKRRRDLNHADIQRRDEIQRRIRHRQYFFQRQRRMLMVSALGVGSVIIYNYWRFERKF